MESFAKSVNFCLRHCAFDRSVLGGPKRVRAVGVQVTKPRELMLPGIELMSIVSTEQTVLALSTTVPT
jgi:hypothetical protein